MRALLLALLLCGCTKNHDELRARLADADRQLAMQQASAQRLLEDRRALMKEEDELEAILAEFPEESALLEASVEAPPVMPTFPPLPPESAFEGAEGARLRLQLRETELRITELAKVIGEAGHLAARRQHVQRQLELIRQRHR